MSNSVRPHRQPTRLPHPWDSPGKNTGVGCHFLLQCMKVKSESEVAQSCLTPSDSLDCSPPGSSIHGIFQARVLVWGAIADVLFKDLLSEATLPRSWWLHGDRNSNFSSPLIPHVLIKKILGNICLNIDLWTDHWSEVCLYQLLLSTVWFVTSAYLWFTVIFL